MQKPRLSLTAILAGCVLPYVADAHHSYAEYDDTQIVELDGTLIGVSWQNPHVHFKVETMEANGRVRPWVTPQ